MNLYDDKEDYINITSKLINPNDAIIYTYDETIKLLENMINKNQFDQFDM